MLLIAVVLTVFWGLDSYIEYPFEYSCDMLGDFLGTEIVSHAIYPTDNLTLIFRRLQLKQPPLDFLWPFLDLRGVTSLAFMTTIDFSPSSVSVPEGSKLSLELSFIHRNSELSDSTGKSGDTLLVFGVGS